MLREAVISIPRIAFSTLAFPDADLATALSLGRSWGYAGVELRLIDGELIDPAMLPEARARVKRTLAAAGLPAVAVDSSIRLTGEHPGTELRQFLELASDWEAPLVRVFGGALSGDGVVRRAQLAAAARVLEAAAPTAERLGVAIGVETHRLVAVTDAVPERAVQFAGSHGCAAEPGLDALLARDDIEVVSVCVPSGLHAEVGIQAAAAGKHLVVEKPIDVSLAAADRLIDAANAAGVAMTVISQHRFDPGLVELRGLIDDGMLGRLVLGEASTKWYRSQGYYDSGPWRGTWALDGGSLMNQGIHYVDLLRATMGPVIEVSAVYATQDHKIEVEDTALAVLRFTSGAVGTIVSSTAVFPGFAQRLEVSGTGGTVVVEDGEIVRSAFTSGSPDPGLRGTRLPRPASAEGAAANAAALGVASHAAQIADLLTAIEQGREPSVTGRDGRDALEVVLAVYESAREGRPAVLLDPTQAGQAGHGPQQ